MVKYFRGCNLITYLIAIGYLSKQTKKWLNTNGSRTLDAQFKLNMTGHGFKLICRNLPLALWHALWISDKHTRLYFENNEDINCDCYLPTLLFSSLWCIHMKFRRMWSVLWQSKINLNADTIVFMQNNAQLGGYLTYMLTPALVSSEI